MLERKTGATAWFAGVAVLLAVGLAILWSTRGPGDGPATEPGRASAAWPVAPDQGHAQRSADPASLERVPAPKAPAATEPAGTDALPRRDLPLLVAGVVVDPGGARLPDVPVTVAELVEDISGFGARSTMHLERGDLATHTDEHGAFEVRGTVDSEQVVVAAQTRGRVLREVFTGTTPATGIVLVLEREGSVTATLAAGSEALAWLIHAEVRWPGTTSAVDGTISPFDDGEATRRGLRPGTYDFAIVGRHDHKALWTAHGIVVPDGPAQDARLIGIDLRGVATPITVRLVDGDGRPQPGRTVFAFDGTTGRGHRTDDDGELAMIAGPAGVDVEVREPGHRRVRCEGVRNDITIRLVEPLRVTLSCAGIDPADAAPGRLHLFVRPQTPRLPPTGDLGAILAPAPGEHTEIAFDEPGPYQVTWAIALDGDGGTSWLHPIDVAEQTIAVTERPGLQHAVVTIDRAGLLETAARAALLRDFEPGEGLSAQERQARRLQRVLELNRRR